MKVNNEAAKEAKAVALAMQETRESVTLTLGAVWAEYVAERKPYWSELHHHDHVRAMQAGGEKRTRSNKEFTEPGILARLLWLNSRGSKFLFFKGTSINLVFKKSCYYFEKITHFLQEKTAFSPFSLCFIPNLGVKQSLALS